MKTLRMRLIMVYGSLVLVICLLLGGVAVVVAGGAMRATAYEQLGNTAHDASLIIGGILDREVDVMRQIAAIARIANPASPEADRVGALKPTFRTLPKILLN